MDVVYSDECALHHPPYEVTRGQVKPYAESPARFLAIKNRLQNQPGMYHMIPANTSDDMPMAPLHAVHTPDFIDFLQTIYGDWVADGGSQDAAIAETFVHPGLVGPLQPAQYRRLASSHVRGKLGIFNFDLSVAYTQDTWRSVRAAAQVAVAAAHRIKTQQSRAVYALCRPPGHHAACNVAGGYCFINNAAVATRYLQQGDPSKNKVLILDVDFHHGNGTQDIFYDDPSVMYVSLHGYPGYPYFTGSQDEQGRGEGLGCNINIPLDPATTTDSSYLAHLEAVLQGPELAGFNPHYVVCSLGLDTWHEDPVAGMKGIKRTETYTTMGRLIKTYAGDRPVMFVQEGGCHIESLGQLVCCVLEGFNSVD